MLFYIPGISGKAHPSTFLLGIEMTFSATHSSFYNNSMGLLATITQQVVVNSIVSKVDIRKLFILKSLYSTFPG